MEQSRRDFNAPEAWINIQTCRIYFHFIAWCLSPDKWKIYSRKSTLWFKDSCIFKVVVKLNIQEWVWIYSLCVAQRQCQWVELSLRCERGSRNVVSLCDQQLEPLSTFCFLCKITLWQTNIYNCQSPHLFIVCVFALTLGERYTVV